MARRPVNAVRPGSRHEVRISGITSEGAGVGRLPDGRAVFVHRTAPGDRVRVEVGGVRARWARARAVELLEPGPDRREPVCRFYARCGGCTLEHLAYPAQLRAKGGIVTEALKRIGKRETGLPEPELRPSPREIRYRNRVTFTLRRAHPSRRIRDEGGEANSGGVVAGFHELDDPGSLIDVDGRCMLPEEAVATAWDGLRAAWGRDAHRLPPGPALRLTLRGLSGGEVVLLVDGGRGRGEPEALIEAVPSLRAIWQRTGGPDGRTERARLLAGERRLVDTWHGEEVEVDPEAFLQPNREAASVLFEQVIREAGEVSGFRVLDAYCGYGVYGRALAGSGARVVGIDADPAAARMARAHSVTGFRVVEGRVEERLVEGLPADLVILNPPRVGVAAGVMDRIAGAAPARILYVSCDPATLARDLRRLGDGYRISRLQVFDLFPQTAHVETVVTLEPAGTPGEGEV